MEEKKPIDSFISDLFVTLLWATNTNEIDRIVDSFLEKICQYFDFDAGEIYFPTGDLLILRGVYGIDRYYVCKVDFPVEAEHCTMHLKDQRIYIGENHNYSQYEVFSNYKTKFVLPIFSYPKPIGILVIRCKEDKTAYFSSLIPVITSLLGHFSVYANNVLQRVTYKDSDNQLKLLRDLYAEFSDINMFEKTFDNLALNIAKIFSARKAFLRFKLMDGTWVTRSSWGFPSDFDYSIFGGNQYIKDYHQKGIYYINEVNKHEKIKDFHSLVNRSILFSPLKINNESIGYIIVIDRIPDAVNPLGDFTINDVNLFKPLLINITSRISEHYNILRLSEANAKNAQHMSRLNTLYDISNVLLERSKTEDILFLLLTVTTIGDVFAFNRAFAFLYDKEFNVFRGRMCVAPKDGQDANNIWSSMQTRDKYGLREKLLLTLGEKSFQSSWDLNQRFLNIVIPNNNNCELFSRVYSTNSSINITKVENNILVEQLKKYTDIFGEYPFSVIPIANATNCIGMIVVDNPYNRKPIPDDDLDYLRMFGRQAAVALEYSALYNDIEKNNAALKIAQKSLLDAQHLALIGEMSSSIAHNLRNFIVPIAGFANRLIKISTDEKVKDYAEIIANEVDKLEIYIRKNLSFAKSIKLEPENINVDTLLESLSILAKEHIKKREKNIKFFTNRATKNETVYWDYERINEALLDLIVNATDAIENETKDENYSFISVTIADNSYAESMIDIIVENTDSYIEPEIMDRIFAPFFTTKSHGVGIGLPTCKRIIEAHGGSMMIKSIKNDFSVTAFFITIPDKLPYVNN